MFIRFATCFCVTALLFTPTAHAELITIANPGNAGDVQSQGTFGAVGYTYKISTTEVSNSEYTAFLNAVAATDTNAIYNTNMSNGFAGITRSGSAGSYSYTTNAGRENNPVVYVSFYDSLRYANWLHNGSPTGMQGNSTTEDGAYTITADGITNNSITRNAGAQFFLTSEDEWYKAAYYNPGTASYFDYATGIDTVPIAEAPAGGTNSANYSSVVGNSTAVGAYTDSDSPYGTFDQTGNVWELNEAVISSSARGLRGGNWFNNFNDLPASNRNSFNPTSESYNVGFRVASLDSAAVPEPGSLALLSVLGVCGLWRVRRRLRQ